MHDAPTAGIILIGNELLSGKIVDQNAAYLTRRLHGLGVMVRRVVIIPDGVDLIAEEVRVFSEQFDHVFTSGGVGPTHDDMTIAGVARAFGVSVITDQTLADILTGHFGDRLTEAHMQMATVPDGAHLIHGGEITWPVVSMRNVYVLPGVPQIFRAKIETIIERFRHKEMVLQALLLNADEGEIAAHLAEVEVQHSVSIGSYPRLDRDSDHRVKVTVESLDGAAVEAAIQALLDRLDATSVVRVER
ncbi:MAG: competence/damage-inducible protein A [Bradymonadia bacterium]